MAILQEKNRVRELKTINLLTDKSYSHFFDQDAELSKSDGLRS
jgi:hypothetical protein